MNYEIAICGKTVYLDIHNCNFFKPCSVSLDESYLVTLTNYSLKDQFSMMAPAIQRVVFEIKKSMEVLYNSGLDNSGLDNSRILNSKLFSLIVLFPKLIKYKIDSALMDHVIGDLFLTSKLNRDFINKNYFWLYKHYFRPRLLKSIQNAHKESIFPPWTEYVKLPRRLQIELYNNFKEYRISKKFYNPYPEINFAYAMRLERIH